MILNLKHQIDIEFFKSLGELYYAIAISDNCVRDEEFYKLEEVLDNEWVSLDDFNLSSKAIIVNMFKSLQITNSSDAEVYYNNFVSFKRTHEILFNDKVKSLILKTATQITSSFSKQNKSELIMLSKLNIELKK